MARVTSPTDLNFFTKLEKTLSQPQSKSSLYNTIANAPFNSKTEVTKLGLGIIILLVQDEDNRFIRTKAMSSTYHAAGAVKTAEKSFRRIKIPVHYPKNLVAKAIDSGKPQVAYDWQYVFRPTFTRNQARYSQDGAAIACSEVWPLKSKNESVLVFSYYDTSVKLKTRRDFMKHYTILVSKYLD